MASLVSQSQSHIPHRNKTNSYTLVSSLPLLIFFLLLLLACVLFFSKNALEPSLSLYRDNTNLLWSQNSTTDTSPSVPSSLLPISPPPVPTSTLSEKGAVVDDNGEKGNEGFSSDPETKCNDSISNGVGDHLSIEMGEMNSAKKCDLYAGRWVRDDEYPIYKPGSCPYVDEAFSCQGNGRRDSEYLKWRWKPEGCDLPRFNATDFLERLRGKRLMLVGDSMNRNQFESILCLLREGLSNKSRMYEARGYKITKGRGYYVFKFEDYNCTVEFVRSHFLVREGTRINGQGQSNPTLSIDIIDKSAGQWKLADILVFNTGHWWTHGKTARGKNYYKEGDVLYPKFDAIEAHKRAMKTWARWIDENLNPKKKLVFYCIPSAF